MIRCALPLMVGVALLVGCTGHLDFDPTVGTAGIEKTPAGTGGAPAMDAPLSPAPWPEAGAPNTGVSSTGGASGGGSVGAAGADGGASAADTTAPTSACPAGFNVLTAVFANKCGGCHGAASPTKNLDLVTAGIGTRMVNKMSTCNNEPLISSTLNGTTPTGLLFEKLAGKVTGCGVQMPAGGPPLTPTEITCVNEWAVAAINKVLGK
jgi:hypothetical protein